MRSRWDVAQREVASIELCDRAAVEGGVRGFMEGESLILYGGEKGDRRIAPYKTSFVLSYQDHLGNK
ncbi:hypothetical protein NL676_038839 [Syzygium grande]|nr:hypothetical protein NL676_038839 [Syzygium grande]